MTGKDHRTTNVNFLRVDFSVLILDEYLQLLATNKHEKSEISQQRRVKPIDPNSDNIRKYGMQFCNEIRRQGIECVRRHVDL
jgi:hypothetical protein